MYRNEVLIKELLPTVKNFKAAIKLADDELSTRDTRPLLSFCERLTVHDSRIRNHIRTRKVGVTSFPWLIQAKDTDFQEDANKALDACESVIYEILNRHTNTPLYGCSAIELDWNLDEALGLVVPSIKKVYQATEIIWASLTKDLLLIPGGDFTNKIPVPQDNTPERKFYIIDSDGEAAAGGCLRPLIISQIIKKDNWGEWANFNSMLKGIITVLIDQDSDKSDVLEAAGVVQAINSERAAIVGKNLELKLTEIVSAQGHTSFESIINKTDMESAVGIIGQSSTTDLPNNGGSRAAVEVLKKISADILVDDKSRVERIINKQLLRFYHELNKGEGAGKPPYEFRFNYNDDYSLEERARTAETLIGAGIPLKSEELYSTIGFTKPDGVGDIFNMTLEPVIGNPPPIKGV